MTDEEYYSQIELLLENHIGQVKKASFLFQDSDRLIKKLSLLVDRTRKLRNDT